MQSSRPVTVHRVLLIFVYCFGGIYALNTSTPCSAINAYVRITSVPHTHLNGTTLLSSHALFAPQSYYVPPTSFVNLNTTVDDICAPSGNISTDISNKIVLLFESEGNCSAQYKVHVAQTNGARAVLIANSEPTDEVVPIAAASDSLSTSIPIRSISFEDGESLLTQLELGNAVIFGEFGCFDSEYSASLCLTDSSGDYWYADGEYQRMADLTFNGHPVWMKDGVALSIHKLYIYLHICDDDSDWLWVISYDPFFTHDEDIRLKCTSSVHDPSLCPQWIGINDSYVFYQTKQSHFCAHYNKHWHCDKILNETFQSAPGITISDTLCAADTGPSSRLCITSDTKLLTPFMGEYYQYNQAKAIWIREMNECDQKPAALLFDGVGFALLDPLNRDFIASCFLEKSLLNSSQFDPSACGQWKSIHDHSYNEDNLLYNDGFTVTMSACAEKATCEAIAAPDAFCMTSNKLLNGMLSGTFVRTNVTGPEYGSPEYKRTTPMIQRRGKNDQNEEEVDLYIWYRSEIVSTRYAPQYEDYPKYRNWALVGRSLTDALVPYEEGRKSKLRIYGICDGFAFGNPLNCKHWSFKTQRFQYLRDDDVEMFAMDETKTCPDNTAPVAPATWPQYICVGLKDDGMEFGGTYSTINSNFFVGGYELSGDDSSEPWNVKWVKQINDNWDFEVYIDYDYKRGTWELEGVWNDTEWDKSFDSWHHKRDFYRRYSYDFKCDAWQKDVLNPLHCDIWYDEDYELLDNMYLYECSAADMITKSPTNAPTVSPTATTTGCGGEVIVVYNTDDSDPQAANIHGNESKGNTNTSMVIGVILCVMGTICIIISIWLYYKGRDGQQKRGRKVVSTKDADVEEMEIAAVSAQTHQGKYDMSPLNSEV